MEVENVKVSSINEDVVKLLLSFNWFGNVRQLENIIHHTIIMTYDDKIEMDDMPENISSFTTTTGDSHMEDGFIKKEDVIITSLDLEEMEKTQIVKALEKAHWKISEAARILGIHRNTLTQKIKKHNIK